MSKYTATIRWQRAADEIYTDNQYSRAHEWHFDGGAVVAASSSPQVVPLPLSNAANVDPEEAFVAALSSCHMLFFLSIAATRGFTVDSYVDAAAGVMEKDDQGVMRMTNTYLRPVVGFANNHLPDRKMLERMHHQAHKQCFIANSVTTKVTIELGD